MRIFLVEIPNNFVAKTLPTLVRLRRVFGCESEIRVSDELLKYC